VGGELRAASSNSATAVLSLGPPGRDGGPLQSGPSHWPELGRFIQQDPIGDGINWYAYAEDNPVTGIDPEGLAYLIYDYGEGALKLYHDTGALWRCYPAISGNKKSGLLPISPGKYRADPAKISPITLQRPKTLIRYFQPGWGHTRLTLDPTADTNQLIQKRPRSSQHPGGKPGGFFIHGGSHSGTAGCIKLPDFDVDDLFDILKGIGTPVGLTVVPY
jgi:hypothetical protein